jgi:hypothetical protein
MQPNQSKKTNQPKNAVLLTGEKVICSGASEKCPKTPTINIMSQTNNTNINNSRVTAVQQQAVAQIRRPSNRVTGRPRAVQQVVAQIRRPRAVQQAIDEHPNVAKQYKGCRFPIQMPICEKEIKITLMKNHVVQEKVSFYTYNHRNGPSTMLILPLINGEKLKCCESYFNSVTKFQCREDKHSPYDIGCNCPDHTYKKNICRFALRGDCNKSPCPRFHIDLSTWENTINKQQAVLKHKTKLQNSGRVTRTRVQILADKNKIECCSLHNGKKCTEGRANCSYSHSPITTPICQYVKELRDKIPIVEIAELILQVLVENLFEITLIIKDYDPSDSKNPLTYFESDNQISRKLAQFEDDNRSWSEIIASLSNTNPELIKLFCEFWYFLTKISDAFTLNKLHITCPFISTDLACEIMRLTQSQCTKYLFTIKNEYSNADLYAREYDVINEFSISNSKYCCRGDTCDHPHSFQLSIWSVFGCQKTFKTPLSQKEAVEFDMTNMNITLKRSKLSEKLNSCYLKIVQLKSQMSGIVEAFALQRQKTDISVCRNNILSMITEINKLPLRPTQMAAFDLVEDFGIDPVVKITHQVTTQERWEYHAGLTHSNKTKVSVPKMITLSNADKTMWTQIGFQVDPSVPSKTQTLTIPKRLFGFPRQESHLYCNYGDVSNEDQKRYHRQIENIWRKNVDNPYKSNCELYETSYKQIEYILSREKAHKITYGETHEAIDNMIALDMILTPEEQLAKMKSVLGSHYSVKLPDSEVVSLLAKASDKDFDVQVQEKEQLVSVPLVQKTKRIILPRVDVTHYVPTYFNHSITEITREGERQYELHLERVFNEINTQIVMSHLNDIHIVRIDNPKKKHKFVTCIIGWNLGDKYLEATAVSYIKRTYSINAGIFWADSENQICQSLDTESILVIKGDYESELNSLIPTQDDEFDAYLFKRSPSNDSDDSDSEDEDEDDDEDEDAFCDTPEEKEQLRIHLKKLTEDKAIQAQLKIARKEKESRDREALKALEIKNRKEAELKALAQEKLSKDAELLRTQGFDTSLDLSNVDVWGDEVIRVSSPIHIVVLDIPSSTPVEIIIPEVIIPTVFPSGDKIPRHHLATINTELKKITDISLKLIRMKELVEKYFLQFKKVNDDKLKQTERERKARELESKTTSRSVAQFWQNGKLCYASY